MRSAKFYLYTLWFCILAGCALDPQFELKELKGTSPDKTGAVKFQLPSAIITAERTTKYDKDRKAWTSKILVSSVNAPDNSHVFSLSGRKGYFRNTTILPKTSKKRLLQSISVETEDKIEDRIKSISSLAQQAAKISLFGGAVGTDSSAKPAEWPIETPEEIEKVFQTFPEKWALDLRNTKVKPGDWVDIGTGRNDSEGWQAKYTYGNLSKTGFDLNVDEAIELAKKGILIHSSCRDLTLELRYVHEEVKDSLTDEYIPGYVLRKNEVVAYSKHVESIKFPAKGTVTFDGCSANVTKSNLVERDVLKLINTTLSEAETVAKAFEEDDEGEDEKE